MSTHRIEATLSQDGKLVLEDLPFLAGDRVEVLILERNAQSNGDNLYPLRGSVIKYEAPTEPVGVEDWDAIR